MKPCGCRHNPALPRFHSGDYQGLWNRMFDALPKVTQAEMLKKGAHNRKIVSLFNAKVMREFEKKQMRPNPMKRRKNPTSTPDNTAAHELILFGVNDSGLYFKSAKPIIANLAAKVKRGIYDAQKALKLWEYHAERAARKYAKEFSVGNDWNTIFTAATRRLAAKEFADHYQEELDEASGKRKNPLRVRRLSSGKFSVKSGRRIHAKATTRLRAMRQASLIRGVKHGWRPTGRPARDVRRKLRRLSRKPGSSLSIIFGVRRGRRWMIRTKPGGGRVIAKGLSLDQLRARARKAGYKVRSL